MKPGQETELRASELSFGGGTVARLSSGFVVFVPYLAPGDRARVVIERVKSNHARGRLTELLEPGPDRTEPPCPVFGTCGGCQWQHVTLNAQRGAKEMIVRRFLEPFGLARKVKPMRAGKEGYGYRNRLILPLRPAGKRLHAGFFRARSHEIVEIDSCVVQHRALWSVARDAVSLVQDAGVPGYDEEKGKGLLRHLVVRRAAGTGELGVVFVSTRRHVPELEAVARRLAERQPKLKGVGLSVNSRRTNVIMGSSVTGVLGRQSLNERLAGLDLEVPSAGFFQANPEVTEMMLEILRGWTKDETGGILDLYCGVGLMGLAAAGAGNASWLGGVEENLEAARAAGRNAARNRAVRLKFKPVTGEVEKALPRLKRKLPGLGCVLVDPPRKGLSPQALAAILALDSRRLVYVSCDPATFSRDMKGILAAGYRLEELVPLDMFPQTYHIELMALFVRD